jgi:hypothetical protein
MVATLMPDARPQEKLAGVYDDEFFDVIDRTAVASARVIVPIVKELVATRSVVDVGCGRGAWLKVFLEQGTEVVKGYDGAYVDHRSLLIEPEAFVTADLSQPLADLGEYDLAVCLEVGEHLPRRMARPLVEALCGAAPAVLFSAAIPGQGGTHHINEQWPDYWRALFRSFGYVQLDPVRRRILGSPDVAFWYKQNVFLFVREAIVAADERLNEERQIAQASEVEIIARYRLTPMCSVRGLAGELVRAIIRSIRGRIGL